MPWSHLEPVLIAAAIGAMIGAERERSHPEEPGHVGGVRTFTTMALIGALAALVSPTVVAVGLGAVAAVVVAGSWPTMRTDPGTTTMLAGLATYLLGASTGTRPRLAVAVAVLLVVLLMSKERVHRVLRRQVSDTEMTDAVKLAVVAFVVLPVLPDRGMGPYQVLNPFRIWLLVVAIVGIGCLGYLGVKLLGARRGLLVSGAAGGFVSASATTSAMGRTARDSPDRARPALAGALAASISTMAQLLLVVGVVSTKVLAGLWLPALAAAIALGLAIALILRGDSFRGDRLQGDGHGGDSLGPPDDPATKPESEADDRPDTEPDSEARAFALKPALILAAIITSTVLVSRWASGQLGQGGAIAIAAIAGLADGHAGAVSAAALASRGELDVTTAVWAAGASIGTNTAVKLGLALTSGGARFGWSFALRMAPAALAFALVLALT